MTNENQANEFAVKLLFDPTTLEYGQTKQVIAQINGLPFEVIDKIL